MPSVSTPRTHYGKTLVGPFSGSAKPTRDGLYIRVSPKSGNLVFSHYSARDGWSAYATCPERAMELRRKRTRKPVNTWYGFART